jgi:hypothetical protein
MARPSRRGLAKSRFFGTPAIIGVSTKPGLIVRTLYGPFRLEEKALPNW